MDSEDVTYDSKMMCPVLFIPKSRATILTPCDISDDLFMKLKICVIDIHNQEAKLYIGLCNVKFVDYDAQYPQLLPTLMMDPESKQVETLPKMLVLSPPKDPKVWIDPDRNPYLNSNYNTNESQTKYSVDNEHKNKPFKQYKRRNVRNKCSDSFDEVEINLKKCKSGNEVSDQDNSPLQDELNESDAFESEIFLSLSVGEIEEKESQEEGFVSMESETENSALKQLMSPDIQLPNKQQKTILFIGHDNQDAKTIQKITVNDPLVKCIPGAATDCESGVETDENSTRREYQCDKCKQTFDQLATFKQHMVNHWNKAAERPSDRDDQYMCSQCGKKLKSREKFEKHCLGHGDPDLECDKCFKVFASKFTLRTHRKIHMRKYPCEHCTKTFSRSLELKAHAAKVHSEYNCDTCEYTASDNRDLEAHQSSHEGYASGVKELEIGSDITIGNRSPEYSPPPRANEEMASEDNDWEDVNKTDADAIISRVISNKIFLLHSKAARKQKRYNKV
ncbi:uncharacterized protein [Battus philenor]|uniref:uncharacterized protein n=1 Tax=Battus philenor TaxID=42288 RepID=UPI0035CF06C3